MALAVVVYALQPCLVLCRFDTGLVSEDLSNNQGDVDERVIVLLLYTPPIIFAEVLKIDAISPYIISYKYSVLSQLGLHPILVHPANA